MTSPLFVREPEGHYREATPKEIVAAASSAVGKIFGRGSTVSSPRASVEFLTLKLALKEHEVFCCLFLDNKHRILCFEEMFRGSIDSASVYPREVVKAALKHNAAAVILAHKHPSATPEPSKADQNLTGRLKDALALIDVRVLDHIIIGDGYFSFAEGGIL